MQTFIFVNITKKKKKDLGKDLYRLRNVTCIILSGYLIYISILCAYFFLLRPIYPGADFINERP